MRIVGMSSTIRGLMSLQPRELINWFHTQTPHRLNQDDEQAILRHAIGGLAFLEFGTEEYLAKAGISYGSCSVLAALRANVLKKSEGPKIKLQSDIEQLVSSYSTTFASDRAAKVKERHDRVLEHFQKNFGDVDNAKKLLSAPNTTFNIPFPYAGPAVPSRFNPGS